MNERRGEHPFGDEGQLIALVVFAAVWVVDTFFLNWTTFLETWVRNPFRDDVLYLALAIAAVLLMSGRVVISGSQRPDHVVDTGVFHYVRHPLYLAVLLLYFGTAFSSFSLISFALLIPIYIFYNFIATYEEKLLETKFGESYRAYERRTGKWLPGLGKKS